MGFDLGAGAIHLIVAKTDEERRQVLASHRTSLGTAMKCGSSPRAARSFFWFSCALRQRLQRILFAADDRLVVAHSAWETSIEFRNHNHQQGVGSVLGFSVLCLELTAGDFLLARRWPT